MDYPKLQCPEKKTLDIAHPSIARHVEIVRMIAAVHS